MDIEEVEEQASELENNINDAVSSGNTEKAVDTIGSVLASLSFASDPKVMIKICDYINQIDNTSKPK